MPKLIWFVNVVTASRTDWRTFWVREAAIRLLFRPGPTKQQAQPNRRAAAGQSASGTTRGAPLVLIVGAVAPLVLVAQHRHHHVHPAAPASVVTTTAPCDAAARAWMPTNGVIAYGGLPT